MIKTLLSILLLSQSIGWSQSILSKYTIDNTHKVVSIPFNDVYIWSNYFVRYEFLHNSNLELNQIVTKQLQIDSTNKINHNLVYNTFIQIHQEDSIQREILLEKIAERDVKIDTLKSEKNAEINKNFVLKNVTLPNEKNDSFNAGKSKGQMTGGIIGTVLGGVIALILKISI